MLSDDRPEFLFVGAREVRVLPRGWQHPRDASRRFIPLLPAGEYPATIEARRVWAREHGRLPRREHYMPEVGGHCATEIMAYETTSEGTPISPAFPDTPAGRRELVRWCAEHCTTFGDHRAGVEAWAAILFGDAAVDLGGTVHASS